MVAVQPPKVDFKVVDTAADRELTFAPLTCTDAMFSSCKIGARRKCNAITDVSIGPVSFSKYETPVLNVTTCCPSCYTAPADTEPLGKCVTSRDRPVAVLCVGDAKPEYDSSTCGRTCTVNTTKAAFEGKPTLRKSTGAQESVLSCTKDQFQSCVRRTAICVVGEKPLVTRDQCCPSCTPPLLLARASDKLKCFGISRVCNETLNEIPSTLPNTICETCRVAPFVPPANCSANCSGIGSYCVLNRVTKATECRSLGDSVAVTMRSEADGECSTSRLGCDTLPTTNVTVKQFIQDIVTRRCYSVEKIGQCTEAALQEIAYLQVTKFERTDMKTNDVYVGESVVTFTLIMPKPVVRGRDQSVDIAALVVDSLANRYSNPSLKYSNPPLQGTLTPTPPPSKVL